MPTLSKNDFRNAIALGSAIDDLEKSEDGSLPLSQDVLEQVRIWLDNDPDRLGEILKAAAIFPDEEIGNLLSCIQEKSDCTDPEWASLAQMLYDEYLGQNAGSDALKVLFG